MTRTQLEDLTDDELGLVLYVVNVIDPPCIPKMTWEVNHLLWFRHDQLIKKLVDVFPKLKPEGHATYVSLMQKLGVCIQIQPPNSTNEIKQGTENTGSNQCPQSQSLSSDVQSLTGSNDPGKPS